MHTPLENVWSKKTCMPKSYMMHGKWHARCWSHMHVTAWKPDKEFIWFPGRQSANNCYNLPATQNHSWNCRERTVSIFNNFVKMQASWACRKPQTKLRLCSSYSTAVMPFRYGTRSAANPQAQRRLRGFIACVQTLWSAAHADECKVEYGKSPGAQQMTLTVRSPAGNACTLSHLWQLSLVDRTLSCRTAVKLLSRKS